MNFFEALKKNFPYSEFRSNQLSILEKIWARENVLALMPTGMGKSLCYQYPAKIQKNLVIVISPLIALMQDQRVKAEKLGIQAIEIHSNISSEQRQIRQKKLASGEYSLLFVTPERFSKSEFRDAIKDREIFLLAIDEAHCVSLWGHDFRPDYAKIPEIRKFLKNPPVLALTATATPQVQEDILQKLDLKGQMQILSSGVERPNLSLNVLEAYGVEEKLERLLANLKVSEGSVIIYSVLIQTVHKISQALQSKKIPHWVYHGDLNPSQRREALKKFMGNEKSLMVATPAFGLGIDKPNIRQIFNFEIPGSLEEYFQQVGRAGRDGKLSESFFLFDEEDVSIQMEFVKWSHPEKSYIEQIYKLMSSSPDRLRQEGLDFLREQISFKNKKDFRVEAAVAILERWGCLQRTEDMASWVCLQEPNEEMFRLEDNTVLMKAQNMKLLDMLRWAKSQEGCRMKKIYKYFGHEGSDCGICDLCRS